MPTLLQIQSQDDQEVLLPEQKCITLLATEAGGAKSTVWLKLLIQKIAGQTTTAN